MNTEFHDIQVKKSCVVDQGLSRTTTTPTLISHVRSTISIMELKWLAGPTLVIQPQSQALVDPNSDQVEFATVVRVGSGLSQ